MHRLIDEDRKDVIKCKMNIYFVFLRNPGKIHITGLVMGAGGRNNNKNINIVPLRVVYVDHLITNI